MRSWDHRFAHIFVLKTSLLICIDTAARTDKKADLRFLLFTHRHRPHPVELSRGHQPVRQSHGREAGGDQKVSGSYCALPSLHVRTLISFLGQEQATQKRLLPASSCSGDLLTVGTGSLPAQIIGGELRKSQRTYTLAFHSTRLVQLSAL